jgi:hypothetical protein
MDMEFTLSNISYLTEPTAVISSDERRRREQGMKKKKGGEGEKKSAGGAKDETGERGRVVDLTV